jgi:hypothetical protein
MEYDYQGKGHAAGSFEIQPMQHVWVGPATLVLDGGTLTAGEHLISKAFGLRADVKVERFDIQAFPRLTVFRPISASVQIDAPLEDLGVARLYASDLELSGKGTLHADLQLAEGRLTPLTVVEVKLTELVARHQGLGLKGKARLSAAVDPISQRLTSQANLDGTITAPFESGTLAADVSGVVAKILLTTNDLVQWPALVHVRAQVAEARIANASAFKAAAAKKAPIIIPQILGDGPLVASGALYLTPAQTLVLLHHAELGGAAIHGAAVSGGSKEGWYGAAAGAISNVSIGLRLDKDQLGVQPLVGEGWLESELAKVGIDPKLAQPPEDEAHRQGRK